MLYVKRTNKCQLYLESRGNSPEILLKLNREREASTLCLICPLSKFCFSMGMRIENAESWSSTSDIEARVQLSHATVVRHALTRLESPEPKQHFERHSRNDFFPLISNNTVKFLRHSSLALSSSSWKHSMKKGLCQWIKSNEAVIEELQVATVKAWPRRHKIGV